MDAAVAHLKTYGEERMLESSDESNAYSSLRCILFGVE
jgi:hypothetical protein